MEPIAVPYGRSFNLSVDLWDFGNIADFSGIETTWTAYRDGAQIASGTSTGETLSIPFSATLDITKHSLRIRFDFRPAGSEEILNSYSINTPLYTIFSDSKPLATVGAAYPPSVSMIELGVGYNMGNLDPETAKSNIIGNIFYDSKLIYDATRQRYAIGSGDSCAPVQFDYGAFYRDYYMADPDSHIVALYCVSTSYLAATLARSIGIDFSFYGFPVAQGSYRTNSIWTMGKLRHGKPFWSFENFRYHQLNYGENSSGL